MGVSYFAIFIDIDGQTINVKFIAILQNPVILKSCCKNVKCVRYAFLEFCTNTEYDRM